MSEQEACEHVQERFRKSRKKNDDRKALIVDDDPFSQLFFKKVLSDGFQGLQIFISSDYENALKTLLRVEDFDVVILDIFLEEEKTGVDLYKLLMKLRHPPVIIMTSALPPSSYFALFPKEMQAPPFLQKPFKPDECISLIESVSGMEK